MAAELGGVPLERVGFRVVTLQAFEELHDSFLLFYSELRLHIIARQAGANPGTGPIRSHRKSKKFIKWPGSSLLNVLQGCNTTTSIRIIFLIDLDRPLPFYFSKHLKTSLLMVSKLPSAAGEPQNFRFRHQLAELILA